MSIRVLVVDDSVVVRMLVSEVLSADPDIEVVATASNGRLALKRLATTAVDLITLDVEMPELDGIATLKELRRDHPKVPVIMFSTLTERGARTTIQALSSGASDYVTKPANMGSVGESREALRTELIPRIKALTAGATVGAAAASLPRGPGTRAPSGVPRNRSMPRAVVIGCSTGGPQALATVLAGLPATFRLPVLVVQHMPALFTRMFAEQLDRTSGLRVVEAADGMPVRGGSVFVAPGDRHMKVVADRGLQPVVRIEDGPPVNFCRPAVDVLFGSALRTYGGATLAVVLTGMGADGAAGAADLRNAGAEVIAQDEATSVVWGMPGAVVKRDAANYVLPLTEIAPTLIERAGAPAATSVGAR